MLDLISSISAFLAMCAATFMLIAIVVGIFKREVGGEEYHPGYSPDCCRGCGNGMILADTRKCELCGVDNQREAEN